MPLLLPRRRQGECKRKSPGTTHTMPHQSSLWERKGTEWSLTALKDLTKGLRDMPHKRAFIANWDDWDEIMADWDDIIPVIPCHWDEIIPVDGGWLPQWDEALDELTGKIEAVYFASY